MHGPRHRFRISDLTRLHHRHEFRHRQYTHQRRSSPLPRRIHGIGKHGYHHRPLLSAEHEQSTNPSLNNQHRIISGPEIGIGAYPIPVALGFSVAYSSAKVRRLSCSGDNPPDSPYLIRRGFINRQRMILIVHLRLNTITLLDFSHHLGSFICMQTYFFPVLHLDEIVPVFDAE